MNAVCSVHQAAQAQPELPLSQLDLAFASYLQQAQPSPDQRHGWLAALVSHQFGRGHACLDLDLLTQYGAAALGWSANWQAALPPDLRAAAPSLPWCCGPASPLVRSEARLYLRRCWLAEQSINNAIAQRLNASHQPAAPSPALLHTLNQLFAEPSATQPDWQKVACVLALRANLTLITGGPGTGKTTTAARLLALLQAQSSQPLRVALAAPTGKAAARLGESVTQALQQLAPALPAHISQAQTLHSLLQVRANRATAAPQLNLDVLLVDEASMIDLELMARLLLATPIHAKLILLGDRDQLASVEAGAVMAQLCHGAEAGAYWPETLAWLQAASGQDLSPWQGTGSKLAQQTVMLRHSYRFGRSSPIGQWAQAVKHNQQPELLQLWRRTPPWRSQPQASVTRLDSFADLAQLVDSNWQARLQQLRQLGGHIDDDQALALLQGLGRFQVLCAMRDGPWGVRLLNHRLAQALGLPTQGWYPGRPVMVSHNDYKLGLMNGDIGLCLPTKRGLRLAFALTQPDGRPSLRWLLPSRLAAADSVFAMTVHKSQGSEFDQVALVLPQHMTPLLTRELLYTGISRAKNRLSLLTTTSILQQTAAAQVLRSGALAL